MLHTGRYGGTPRLAGAADLDGRDPRLSSARLGDDSGVLVQVERPALVAVDAFANPFPAFAVAVEVAVLDLDPGPFGSLGHEPYLPLADLGRVGLDLPVRADVPTEHHTAGRLVHQDVRPTALAAVDAAVIKVPADTGFEHGLGDLGAEQVVFSC